MGDSKYAAGVDAYGKDLNACFGSMSAYGIEEVLASGVGCLIYSRMAYGLPTLKSGTFSTGVAKRLFYHILALRQRRRWGITSYPTPKWNPRADIPARSTLRIEVSEAETSRGS